MNEPADELEAILGTPPSPSPPGMHEAVFRLTERALRRGRWTRRFAKLSAVAALVLLGGAVGWFARPEKLVVAAPPANPPPAVVVVPVIIPVPQTVPDSSASPVARTEPDSAAQAELLAEQADDRAEAARLYRQAGDLYLDAAQDYRNAARCYRLFLARAGDKGLAPETADTWLLTSLKNAAFKEKFHVAKTDG
jgi:hypothetical protein